MADAEIVLKEHALRGECVREIRRFGVVTECLLVRLVFEHNQEYMPHQWSRRRQWRRAAQKRYGERRQMSNSAEHRKFEQGATPLKVCGILDDQVSICLIWGTVAEPAGRHGRLLRT
jgi:hypothetical protein